MTSARKPDDSEGLFRSPSHSLPASADWVTAHCDGGSRGNPGPAGFGVHMEDAAGKVLAELSEYLGVKTNNFAEYSALLAALRFAIEHGHHYLRVVADSELMVKQMKGQYRVNSPELRPLYEQAKSLVRQLGRFEIQHVLRGKNRNADRLANLAMDRGMGRPAAPVNPGPGPEKRAAAKEPEPHGQAKMLRGFTRDGVVHLLGSELPDGLFVKVIPE